MKIHPEEINEFDIETVIRYGRSGLVEGIEPIFWDRLQDYIDDIKVDFFNEDEEDET